MLLIFRGGGGQSREESRPMSRAGPPPRRPPHRRGGAHHEETQPRSRGGDDEAVAQRDEAVSGARADEGEDDHVVLVALEAVHCGDDHISGDGPAGDVDRARAEWLPVLVRPHTAHLPQSVDDGRLLALVGRDDGDGGGRDAAEQEPLDQLRHRRRLHLIAGRQPRHWSPLRVATQVPEKFLCRHARNQRTARGPKLTGGAEHLTLRLRL
mmetsp:Transcript_41570/g.74720  ORF Transcript_41570/g.74720 Transcript_41570/m.74720 type:complete len:210 (-) Transcript_41570:613-1242(-)